MDLHVREFDWHVPEKVLHLKEEHDTLDRQKCVVTIAVQEKVTEMTVGDKHLERAWIESIDIVCLTCKPNGNISQRCAAAAQSKP